MTRLSRYQSTLKKWGLIENPDLIAPRYAHAGCASVTFHYEAAKSVGQTINDIRSNGAKVGIAIKPGTDFSKVEDKTHIGIILSFIATFWASTGNLIHQKNFKDKIPFIQSIAYGMFYGSIFTLIVAKFRGAELIFDYSFSYISSLLYLAIIGSVVAFYLYLKLLESIGSARAGYMGVVMPIIALIISTIFEGLQWSNNLTI